VRCGAGELHVVAAVVGAIGAQEAIKMLTGQFVMVGGTLLYNAMACTTSVFAL
jgi:amyloid beta precursor protein binding protein 1